VTSYPPRFLLCTGKFGPNWKRDGVARQPVFEAQNRVPKNLGFSVPTLYWKISAELEASEISSQLGNLTTLLHVAVVGTCQFLTFLARLEERAASAVERAFRHLKFVGAGVEKA
jgi:hypothetical protein